MNFPFNKFLIALVTAAGEAISQGLIHGDAVKIITVVVAVLGALGVYAIPNAVNEAPEAQ